MTEQTINTLVGSIPEAIEIIRLARQHYIEKITSTEGLDLFLENHFQTFGISNTKREFLLRDLRELSKSSLDLVHYASLIQAYKVQPQPSPENEPFILREVEVIFNKYGLTRS